MPEILSNLPIKKLVVENPNKLFLAILVFSVILGTGSGYLLASTEKVSTKTVVTTTEDKTPQTAQQDTKTFRDFAQGVIQKRPEPKNPEEYVEGTHLLIQEKAPPAALTSSVVDLSQYEGKKVKVFGESQRAIREGWLMDVGRVEVQE